MSSRLTRRGRASASADVRLLLAGVSTRAAAESAARAGFAVTTVDAFADRDQAPRVRSLSLPRDFALPFTAAAAARVAAAIEADAVAYLSNFENHPRAVAALAAGRRLWGNAPGVLRRVRNPLALATGLRARGFTVPATLRDAAAAAGEQGWLLKPLASGGGRGIREWRPGMRLPRSGYLQALVEGVPGSVVFIAAAGEAVPLALTRQLAGEPAFGAGPFRYCGSLLEPVGTPLATRAYALARAVAAEFELVGLNTVDFIAAGYEPHAVEVNPRWSASMELVEQALDCSLFALHAEACERGKLPERAAATGGTWGKAVLFAKEPVTIGDTSPWLSDRFIRDIPHPGERMRRGQPICTILATAPHAADLRAALDRRASRVYDDLAHWRRERCDHLPAAPSPS